jgi:ABC-2 type transport system ATP-binding protein
MIEAVDLSKQYGRHTAVDHVTFTVRPGLVTGFLGPNGAGKSTTLRMVVGLDHPSTGQVLVGGRRYADSPAPLHEVGVLLEAGAVHPGRSARDHLLALAQTHGISRRRVDQVLDLVGLGEVAGRRTRGYSLGMHQRLGIAGALIGDPAVVVLDEPVNGLDPDGIRWIRGLLRSLAAEGRTVFVSSHLMSEMALTADHLLVLGRGRVLADVSMAQMTASAAPVVNLRTPQAEELRRVLTGPGVTVTDRDGGLAVAGLDGAQIARRALDSRVLVSELTPQTTSLEDAYLALTRDDVEYSTTTTTTVPRRAAA